MRHLLSELHLGSLLHRLTEDAALLAFDFDGTLAPIVSAPADARMRSQTRRLLQQISQAFVCAVISSRPQREITTILEGVAVWEVIGNHGLESPEVRARCEEEVCRWVPLFDAPRATYPGLAVENKGQSLAIHYRQVREKERAKAAIQQIVGLLDAAQVVNGLEVVNVRPLGAPGKGAALARLIEQRQCRGVLYVGDDESDEDVFALDQPELLTVRVGRSPDSRAAYFLKAQEEVDVLLEKLLQLRRPAPHRPRALAPRERLGFHLVGR